MVRQLNKDVVPNAQDELFWRKVREAYTMVAADHNVSITLEQGVLGAVVFHDASAKSITIKVYDVELKPTTLIVPHAAGETDPRDKEVSNA